MAHEPGATPKPDRGGDKARGVSKERFLQMKPVAGGGKTFLGGRNAMMDSVVPHDLGNLPGGPAFPGSISQRKGALRPYNWTDGPPTNN